MQAMLNGTNHLTLTGGQGIHPSAGLKNAESYELIPVQHDL